MRKICIGIALASALAFIGCGGPSSSSEAPKADAGNFPAPSSAPPAVPDLANGAEISGKVAFDGPRPVMKPLDMSATPVCDSAHKTPVKSEEVVINKNGTVKNAFVFVKSGLPAGQTWQVPTSPVILTQEGCMYVPHVIGVMTGQNVDIKTEDPTNHNIHLMPVSNPDFNQSQTTGAGDIVHTFSHQEVLLPVKCNIHPWMKAYIGVVSNPFYAVTGDDGSYSIKGLPPGTYTIEMMHEKYGPQDIQITVGPKDRKIGDFTIKG